MTRRAAAFALSLATALALAACGDDDGPAAGMDAGAAMDAGSGALDAGVGASDAGSDDAFFPRADGSTSCGAATCTPDQICLFHCCSVPCEPLAAGATCMGTACNTRDGAPGCQNAACRPAPPECVAVDPACAPTITCGCLPAGSCSEGRCGRFSTDGVACICE